MNNNNENSKIEICFDGWRNSRDEHRDSYTKDVVVKIRHYVRIVRRNRRGYGREGIRAHTTHKEGFHKQGMNIQDTRTYKQGLHTGDTILNAFVKGEVHG